MRKSVLAPAGIIAAVALLTVGTPTASQAFTQKELSLCFLTEESDPHYDLELVADGPSFKTASLDPGDCVAWDVRPGEYKITFEDLDELQSVPAGESCPVDSYPWFEITIKRMGDVYRQYNQAVVAQGAFTTNIKKDRRTAIQFLVQCIEEEDVP